MKNLLYQILGLRSDYEQLFFKNEYAVLRGKKGSKLIRLTIIVFLQKAVSII